MSDLNERLAQEAAELINGGEWRDGKWYSDGHRDAWRRALKPAASRIEKLEAALQRSNEHVEEYERKFYLSTDRIEQLETQIYESIPKWKANNMQDRIEKLEAALRQIKELHHGPEDEDVSVIDSIFMRDDRTYKIVCDTLEELGAPQKRV